MFCRKCGNEIPDDSEFCPLCGDRVITEDFEVTTDSVSGSTVTLEKKPENVTVEPTVRPTMNPDGAVSTHKMSKMKIILISAGALIAVLTIVFFAVILPEMHLEFYYIHDKDKGYYIIQGAKDDMKEINIPNTIWFIPVCVIQDEAFAYSDIESVSFGKNVFKIGDSAFESCTRLKSVEFKSKEDSKETVYIEANPSNHYAPASSSSSMSEHSPTYGSFSNNYDDNSYDFNDDWNEDDYGWLDDITYGDFVRIYRDEVISGAKNVTYQQLARSIDGMEGEIVKITGQIYQVLEEEADGYYYYSGLFNVTYVNAPYFPYYTDSVAFMIPKEYVNVRPLIDDIITIWGVSTGLTSYETVLGDIQTVPAIIAAKVQFNSSDYEYGYGY